MATAAKGHRVRRRPGKPEPGSRPRAGTESPWTVSSVRGLQVLQVAPFKKLAWLVHGFSTRTGGQSLLPSGERVLNLGVADWDSRENVLKNRRALQTAIDAEKLQLVPLRQFHSAVVHCFATAPAELCKGDAALTNSPGLLLGIQTADCVPILLVDPIKRVVAAVHAGWRGTLARIAEKTVGELRKRFRSDPRDLFAALGPAIGGCCYEVGTELVTQFSSQFADAEEWFDELRTGDEPNPLQWLNMMPPGHQPPAKNVRLDLRRANRAQLLAAGLSDKNIFVSDLCTACHLDLFFSYRKEADRSGRLMSLVGMQP